MLLLKKILIVFWLWFQGAIFASAFIAVAGLLGLSDCTEQEFDKALGDARWIPVIGALIGYPAYFFARLLRRRLFPTNAELRHDLDQIFIAVLMIPPEPTGLVSEVQPRVLSIEEVGVQLADTPMLPPPKSSPMP